MKTQDISDELIKRICECGWNAYLVGGAVRDMFANLDPHDFDIVTDATPDEIANIFRDRKVNLVGASFLVTLVDGVEISTYRSDKNVAPGRHNCVTTACQTLDEDLERRDFTFNAMAVCPYTGEVVDKFGGRRDLQNKLIRFVGNPNQRIYEDYLRMIRAARFACLIEGKLEQNTFVAIKENVDLIHRIAPERFRLELIKVMGYRKPSIFFDIMHETGLLKELIPEVDSLYGHPGGKYHNETLCTHFKLVGDNLSPKDPILRLIGYLHDIGKPQAWLESARENFVNHEKIGADMIGEIMTWYRFSHDETERAEKLTLCHMRSLSGDIKKKGIRRMLKAFSEYNVNWKDWIKLKIADRKGNLGKEDYTREEIKNMVLSIHEASRINPSRGFTVKDLAVNGKDVMKYIGINPGPEVGRVLNFLLDVAVDEPEMNTKEKLINFMKGMKDSGFYNRSVSI